MDSDDIMQKDRLRIQCDYLDNHPDVDAVCSCALSIDSSGNVTGRIGEIVQATQITLKMMAEDNCVCNPSSMLRGSFVKNKGLRYNPDYCYAEGNCDCGCAEPNNCGKNCNCNCNCGGCAPTTKPTRGAMSGMGLMGVL